PRESSLGSARRALPPRVVIPSGFDRSGTRATRCVLSETFAQTGEVCARGLRLSEVKAASL
ncbi:MAG: hypothetical protein K6U88_16115, partial [Dehalococcoidia bacterium]|nr:hypothetical protein [Dehalococcoidia bacterium]